ncbi:YxiJ family protein [Paenibacillus yanchengensis]|uniref:YxiJ family protein n=1 Tax=Paenibacillus yanchengensis TaxID=2035833 RepID=A0ABW4YEY4_9BACL
MDIAEILENISDQLKLIVASPSPLASLHKIKLDFVELENENLHDDFNDYCSVVAGTISFVMIGNKDNISAEQIAVLSQDFFERFPQYRLFESSLENYPDFQNIYNNHEEFRKLVLRFINS